MRWTIVVPFKAGPDRKSRLAPQLSAGQRLELSDLLFGHVVDRIVESGIASRILAVSTTAWTPAEPVQVRLQADPVLNAELEAIRRDCSGPLIVVNADLPLLAASDLVALAEAAEAGGCAIAPDRHGSGTNAVALLPDGPFGFAFGPGSLALHRASAPSGTALVERAGLACDVDTIEDARAALAMGWTLPAKLARLLRPGEVKGTHAASAAGE